MVKLLVQVALLFKTKAAIGFSNTVTDFVMLSLHPFALLETNLTL